MDGKTTAFDIPIADISNTSVTGKNEVMVELAQPEHVDKRTDSIVEIRFHSAARGEASTEDGDVVDEDKLMRDDSEPAVEKIGPLQQLVEQIKTASPLMALSSDVLVSLSDLPCLVPRGRFELDMTDRQMRLHGKTYDHKISFSSIVKLFLLPRPDDMHVLFVVALDPPIRQGQTRYPFLVFSFLKDDEAEFTVKDTIDDEALRTRYEGKLQRHHHGATFEVISILFRTLAGQKIIVPGSFKSATGSAMIKCSLKANEGHLYVLERSFFFLPKPTLLMHHQEITTVEFQRVGSGIGNPRTFDLKFFIAGTEHTFSNINKYHLDMMFLERRRCRWRSFLPPRTSPSPRTADRRAAGGSSTSSHPTRTTKAAAAVRPRRKAAAGRRRRSVPSLTRTKTPPTRITRPRASRALPRNTTRTTVEAKATRRKPSLWMEAKRSRSSLINSPCSVRIISRFVLVLKQSVPLKLRKSIATRHCHALFESEVSKSAAPSKYRMLFASAKALRRLNMLYQLLIAVGGITLAALSLVKLVRTDVLAIVPLHVLVGTVHPL